MNQGILLKLLVENVEGGYLPQIRNCGRLYMRELDHHDHYQIRHLVRCLVPVALDKRVANRRSTMTRA